MLLERRVMGLGINQEFESSLISLLSVLSVYLYGNAMEIMQAEHVVPSC